MHLRPRANDLHPPLPHPACCWTYTFAALPQLRRTASTVYNVRTPSRRQRVRSRSPSRGGPSRKRYRSRSPHSDQVSPSDRLEKRARDNSRHPRRDKPEFFQSGAGPRGGVCAVCLGRHEHTFARCEEAKLWDGSVGSARKNEQGRLVAASGFPLCFDWQVPRGCRSTSHPDRHRCSGCGKADHGAQGCPRAEKA